MREQTETARCSVCKKLFKRSTKLEKRYVSCPAHSFGEVVQSESKSL